MEDRKVKFYALGQAALDQFNKAMEEESSKWVTLEKPEASGPTGPSNFLLDEIGHWDHTRINYLGDVWNKLKLNNGN